MVDFKQEDESIWTSANGDIKISDMETDHIRNTLNMINSMMDSCKINDYPMIVSSFTFSIPSIIYYYKCDILGSILFNTNSPKPPKLATSILVGYLIISGKAFNAELKSKNKLGLSM